MLWIVVIGAGFIVLMCWVAVLFMRGAKPPPDDDGPIIPGPDNDPLP